jgi:hypothetical protein
MTDGSTCELTLWSVKNKADRLGNPILVLLFLFYKEVVLYGT